MSSNATFLLSVDRIPFETLDGFALLACQRYNLGNAPDWFGSFRGGLYGMYARLDAVVRHFHEVHSWGSVTRFPHDAEYHLSAALFGMDSTIECCTYALNALGYAIAPDQFKDLTDNRALREIKPTNVYGANPLPGYQKYFPSVQRLWASSCDVIQTIFDQHDVSKHRMIVFQGGQFRNDPPPGFYEALGITDNDPRRFQVTPMAEIILISNPKEAPATRGSVPREQQISFEAVARDYAALVEATGRCALDDARNNIPLKERHLRE